MRSSLLAVTPRIERTTGKLIARTSLKGLLLSLMLLHRTVTVCPEQKTVSIRRRLFWFFTGETKIPFSRIESLSYEYEDWNPNTGLGFSGDTTDCFTVKLNLTDRSQVHLFHFFGSGTFVNNGIYPDWAYWSEYAFDVAGDQAETSRAYVTVLQKLMNVPLK